MRSWFSIIIFFMRFLSIIMFYMQNKYTQICSMWEIKVYPSRPQFRLGRVAARLRLRQIVAVSRPDGLAALADLALRARLAFSPRLHCLYRLFKEFSFRFSVLFFCSYPVSAHDLSRLPLEGVWIAVPELPSLLRDGR